MEWNGSSCGEQQIGQEIGRGGFGVVFQALNTATGDFVAVKRMEMDSVKLDAGASIKVKGPVAVRGRRRSIFDLFLLPDTGWCVLSLKNAPSLGATCAAWRGVFFMYIARTRIVLQGPGCVAKSQR